MKLFSNSSDSHVVDMLNNGYIGVVRTDTLYGLVAKASDKLAVERVYSAKVRTPSKPPIVLIESTSQMFDPAPKSYREFLDEVWPGRNSVVIPAPSAPHWVTRGYGTVAYRIPDEPELRSLIRAVGPIIAPSANTEGRPPAATIDQAIQYFGDKVDFYVDGGEVELDTPSALYRLDEYGTPERLR